MRTRHLTGVVAAAVMAGVLWAVPAEATVHEIVAQWCSGQDSLNPPGVSKPGSKNFAQPIEATGMLQTTFDPVLGAIVVSFDFDHPASKVQSSGVLVQIGMTEEGVPILLDVPEPDPDFPAFGRCPRLGM
ncbi:MAG TPA: hypothetical protein VFZ36_01235 [Vicinamibacterales bacterium]